MNDATHHSDATAAEWAAILAESEAEAEAGRFVSGDEIMRELRESIARMEGRAATTDHTGAVPGSPPRR
jgi:predicted transcriptional regulator